MTKIIKLSERLKLIADQVPHGSRVADIGSDHALLPCYLVNSGQALSAIAGEVNPGPLEAAQKQVREEQLEQYITVREGDGLAVIQPGEVNVITIAGMGGSLIVKILSADPAKLVGIERLVLQPNVGEDTVRQWLLQENWLLVDEHILEEDGKFYEVIVAVRAEDAAARNAELYAANPLEAYGVHVSKEQQIWMGPYLLSQPNAAFARKWESEKSKLERIVQTLQQSQAEESRVKEQAFQQQIGRIEEVLQCLQKGRP
ncbi:tRNA (adenine(22)-N(1))-methyltransferase [Paenibacillus selenitireducens]|uniref:tRNA (adenine(22)-N(1))-methyltransferase n=1 Tax=Paenibacillus selenitireducens TaxID=1324314 RepID=UPI0018E9EFDB|nr:class I SAM-dependent methyltransferase [Paenibacillus selenitireducens]